MENRHPLPDAALTQHIAILGKTGSGKPNTLTNAEAGERANLSHQSGTFSTYLSRLRSLELIEGKGELRASDDLF